MNNTFIRNFELLDVLDIDVLEELPSHTPSCPVCSSTNLKYLTSVSTLLGGGTGVDDDPNHVQTKYFCNSCSRYFTRETKSGNVWYTNPDKRVLRGIPNCFEEYLYPCRCGGFISRLYTALDGKTPISLLTYGETKQFHVYYRCDSCSLAIETDHEYWRGHPRSVLMSKEQIDKNINKQFNMATGFIYTPYIPLVINSLQSTLTLTSRKGIVSRYSGKLIGKQLYGKVIVDEYNESNSKADK